MLMLRDMTPNIRLHATAKEQPITTEGAVPLICCLHPHT